MNKNMGTVDRVARFVAGAAVITAGIVYGSWWGLIGLVLIVTALAGMCPAYMPLGISTCKGEGETREKTS